MTRVYWIIGFLLVASRGRGAVVALSRLARSDPDPLEHRGQD